MHMALLRPHSECSTQSWRLLGFIRKQMSWSRLRKLESSFIEEKILKKCLTQFNMEIEIWNGLQI